MAKKRNQSQTETEAAYIDWSEIGPTGPLPRGVWLKLNAGFTYRIRLFHRPIRFWRVFRSADQHRISVTKRDDEPAACRYVVNLIDRSDGQVKVLEGSEELFIQFRRCHEITGIDPGGAEGFDLAIQVVNEGVARKHRVSFEAEQPTPFSDAEKEKLRQGHLHLPSLFSPSLSKRICEHRLLALNVRALYSST